MELEIRKKIIEKAVSQLGKPYNKNAVLDLENKDPKDFECSNLVCWSYFQGYGIKIVDGTWNQHRESQPTDSPKPADIGFFKDDKYKLVDKSKGIDNPLGIYHVVMFVDNNKVVEARALQKESSFETGKVIYRPLIAIVNYKNFCGWRTPNALQAQV